jgi:hypothetical protein
MSPRLYITLFASLRAQMITDIAVDPASNVWAMNNWQDSDACIGTPLEGLSTRCGGQGVVICYGMVQAGACTADRAGASILTEALTIRADSPAAKRSVTSDRLGSMRDTGRVSKECVGNEALGPSDSTRRIS